MDDGKTSYSSFGRRKEKNQSSLPLLVKTSKTMFSCKLKTSHFFSWELSTILAVAFTHEKFAISPFGSNRVYATIQEKDMILKSKNTSAMQKKGWISIVINSHSAGTNDLFCVRKNVSINKKMQLFWETLKCCIYLRPLLFHQVRMMGQKRRWLSGLTIIKTQHFACRLTSMVKMPSNWVELMIAYGVFL